MAPALAATAPEEAGAPSRLVGHALPKLLAARPSPATGVTLWIRAMGPPQHPLHSTSATMQATSHSDTSNRESRQCQAMVATCCSNEGGSLAWMQEGCQPVPPHSSLALHLLQAMPWISRSLALLASSGGSKVATST